MAELIHQASCVAIDGRALLIEGHSGSGKSTLALALIDRGAVLVGDDGVTLVESGGRLLASPPPNIAGMIEVRNVALVRLPTTSAPVALVIRLDRAAPRHVVEAEQVMLGGIALPQVLLYPDCASLALRAEWALKIHGI